MPDVADTLADRGRSYGEFKDGTKIAMALFGVVQAAPGYVVMSDDKQYAMFMFCAKMARLLNGDSEHQDSWHDIAGYATLAYDRCVVPSGEGTTHGKVYVDPQHGFSDEGWRKLLQTIEVGVRAGQKRKSMF